MNKLKHIAIIMDGNGRWAKKKLFPRTVGHRQGAKTILKILNACLELDIKYLTLYAFSTENWKRPKKEVDTLMNLYLEFSDKELDFFMKNGIKIVVSGSNEKLNEKLIKKMNEIKEKTKNNKKLVLNCALNYGARDEIINAINKIIADKNIEKISEKEFSKYLYQPELPDPELLIRTSGVSRISNFLLWQIAYSEIYITDVLWPDFTKKDLEKAIKNYYNISRNFGGLKDVK